MSYPARTTSLGMPVLRTRVITLTLGFLFMAPLLFGQQSYVSRYNFYAGYTFLDSPHVSLFENGFHVQAGINPATWYALGVDYSISAGNLTLTPSLLTAALQQQLAGLFQELAEAGELPPGYTLAVNSHSRTQTLAAGPQLSYRHLAKATLFLRPSFGAIYEAATPHPNPSDPIATAVVAQLAPTGRKTDWTAFYGFGAGTDLIFSKHVALRVQADLVYDHLFSDLLKDGRWTTRFSVGPCFSVGKNIRK